MKIAIHDYVLVLIFISQSHTNTVTVIVAVFRETRKPVKNTVEYAMGEIMVTMAIIQEYKDKTMGEGYT